jgi:thiamine-phosphate pyrophosphorylase
MDSIPRGLWAVASDIESPQQAKDWQQQAAAAAAFSVRRWPDDPNGLAIQRQLKADGHWLASHGRADLATLAGAQAVIAGVRSLPVAAYRQAFTQLLVGASTHSMDEAQLAVDAGAHFLIFGPVWDTPEKRGILEPRGLQQFVEVAALGVPVIAIGGIEEPPQIRQLQEAGAYGAAVLRVARDADKLQKLVDAWQ